MTTTLPDLDSCAVPEIDIGGKVKIGYLWSLMGAGAGQVLSFVVGIFLARLLEPAEFGVIASCMLFTEIASTVVSSSYCSALIQRKELPPIVLSTGFVLQFLTGIGTAAILVAIAPIAEHIFQNHLILYVLPVLSLGLVTLTISSIPSVIARKQLDFRLLVIATTVQVVVNGLIAVTMAAAGYGVWSLVFGKLISQLVFTFHLCIATGWRPTFQFDGSIAVSLVRLSLKFAGKNILDDLSKNTDCFLVGWRLGTAPLGFYSRAYSLMRLPITQLATSLGNILFPAFANIQDDAERLIRGLLKSTSFISLSVFPVLAGLQLICPSLIMILYGPKWMPTVLPFQILCFAGLFYCIDPPAVSLINARGYIADDNRRQAIHLCVLAGCILLASRWGLAAVAGSVIIAAFVYWILLLQLLNRRMQLSLGRYVKTLVPASLSCAAMGLAVWLLQRTLLSSLDPRNLLNLTVPAILGPLVYGACLWGFAGLTDDEHVREAVAITERSVAKSVKALGRLAVTEK